MAKVLIIGDIHATMSISSRKDIIVDTLRDKFAQIGGLIKNYEIDFVILTGDIFHNKRAIANSHYLVSSLISWFKLFNVPIYSVLGNHDILGNSRDISRQPINTLIEAGVIKLLSDKKIGVCGTFIMGKHFLSEDMVNMEYLKSGVEDVDIVVYHSYIFPDGESFFDTYFNHMDFKDVDAKIIVTGHYHKPKKPFYNVYDKIFINPGSLLRISSESESKNRQLNVVIVDTDSMECFSKCISSLPAEEVFVEKGVSKSYNESLVTFVNELKSSISDVVDISSKEALLLYLKNSGVEKEVIDYISVSFDEVVVL